MVKDIFENEKSGVVNNFLSGSLYIKDWNMNSNKNSYTANPPASNPNEQFEPGNMSRTGQINRIRCVYKP